VADQKEKTAVADGAQTSNPEGKSSNQKEKGHCNATLFFYNRPFDFTSIVLGKS
jgi:hypothetical protein